MQNIPCILKLTHLQTKEDLTGIWRAKDAGFGSDADWKASGFDERIKTFDSSFENGRLSKARFYAAHDLKPNSWNIFSTFFLLL